MNKLEPYKRPCEPLEGETKHRVTMQIADAIAMKARGYKPCFRVGDRVWCVFKDTPKGKVEDGVVIEIINGRRASAYQVMQDYSGKSEYFLDQDKGVTVWLKEDDE